MSHTRRPNVWLQSLPATRNRNLRLAIGGVHVCMAAGEPSLCTSQVLRARVLNRQRAVAERNVRQQYGGFVDLTTSIRTDTIAGCISFGLRPCLMTGCCTSQTIKPRLGSSHASSQCSSEIWAMSGASAMEYGSFVFMWVPAIAATSLSRQRSYFSCCVAATNLRRFATSRGRSARCAILAGSN